MWPDIWDLLVLDGDTHHIPQNPTTTPRLYVATGNNHSVQNHHPILSDWCDSLKNCQSVHIQIPHATIPRRDKWQAIQPDLTPIASFSFLLEIGHLPYLPLSLAGSLGALVAQILSSPGIHTRRESGTNPRKTLVGRQKRSGVQNPISAKGPRINDYLVVTFSGSLSFCMEGRFAYGNEYIYIYIYIRKMPEALNH